MNINIKLKKNTCIINAPNFTYALIYFKCKFDNLYFTFNNKYGNHLMDFKHERHVVYNAQVYKRGKYKNNKYYEFNYYYIPSGLFDVIKINQHNRYFEIITK